MPTPSPAFSVNGTPVSSGAVTVTAGASVAVALVSGAGVDVWTLVASYTDELNTAAAVNATFSALNQTLFTGTFTAPAGLGSAVVLTSQVNRGLDAYGTAQSSYSTTGKASVLTAGGLAVLASNEIFEHNPTFGHIAVVNAKIREGGGTPTYVSWGPAAYPVESRLFTANTTSTGAAQTIATIPLLNNAVNKLNLSVEGKSGTANGITFDLAQSYIVASGVTTVFATALGITDVRVVGTGAAVTPILTISGTNILVQVTPWTATSTNWSVAAQDQERT